MAELTAGVSRVTITPPVGMYLIGMERTEASHGFRDNLYATALAISDGKNEIVIVGMDVLVIHPEMVRRIRQEACKLTHVRSENFMFCASHSHSGPVMHAFSDSNPMIRGYLENLTHLLIGGIRMAHNQMEPARLGFGRGKSGIALNRRFTRPDGVTVISANLEGPIDEEVGVLRIDRLDGTPLATLVNYACHPVVLGNGSNVISADWPGAMRRTVEAVSKSKVIFLQGASADINPWPGVPSDSKEVLERLGMEIGGEVLKVWAGIETQPKAEVHSSTKKLWIPMLPVSQYAGKLPDFVELADSASGMTFEQLQAWLNEYMPWSVELSGKGDDVKAPLEMQCISVGDTALVSAGAEIFVKTGLQVKHRSPWANTIFAAYTNGCLGYIPLAEDYPRGGYEVQEAHLGYRLPAPVAPESAAMVVEAALEMLALQARE
jgi:hypothetical protein